jgi:hypothetical protein
MSDLKYFISFDLVLCNGGAKFIKLGRYFGSLKDAWHAGQKELSAEGIEQRPAPLSLPYWGLS